MIIGFLYGLMVGTSSPHQEAISGTPVEQITLLPVKYFVLLKDVQP